MLTTECRAALTQALALALEEATVSRGQFLNRTSLSAVHRTQRILPERDPHVRRLRQMVDDDLMLEFVYGRLSHELQGEAWCDDESRPLASVPRFADLSALSVRLVESLEALPERYLFSIRLPGSLRRLLPEGVGVDLSKDVCLMNAAAPFMTRLPRTTSDPDHDRRIHNLTLLGGPPGDWEGSYLLVAVDGFVGTFTGTHPTRYAEDTLKAFAGLGLAFVLFRHKRTYAPYQTRGDFLIHRRSPTGYELFEGSGLSSAVAAAWSDLELATEFLEDLGGTTVKGAAQVLTYIRTAFAEGPAGARLRLAAQWFFDSYTADTQLMGYIHAMVCLEILYGDKAADAKLGLNELLKNRCAYAIAKDHAERADILTSFDKIYDVRSRIVHTGQTRLSSEERDHFLTLRSYCMRAIIAETDLLKTEPFVDFQP